MPNRLLFVLGFMVLAIGCNSRPTCVPVSGKVLIDGKPLERGTITFLPEGGRQSTSDIDKSGNFTLSCFKLGDGAIVGKHRISVSSTESLNTENTVIKWFVPRKYTAPESSGLTEQISVATDAIVIKLSWVGSDQKGPFIERLEEGAGGEDPFSKTRERARKKK